MVRGVYSSAINQTMSSAQFAREQALPPGAMIDVFEVRRVLGVGGFGVTYEADDATLNRKVAIKEYFPGALASRGEDGRTISPRASDSEGIFEYGLKRFLDEARILARFHDAHIVRVLRYVEGNGTAYLIMDYEEGESLEDRLRRLGRMTTEDVQQIVVPILSGLRTIHDHHYLHRDIKPDNIFLRHDGTPLLLDFGSARQALEHQQRSMTVVLTPGFAPIEQYAAEEEQGPYTDLYAVGATMFRCLSGRNPPEATARLSALHNKGEDPLQAMYAELGETVDPELVDVVRWLMQIRATDRPQSAQSVLVVMERLGSSEQMRDSSAPTVILGTRQGTSHPSAPAPPASLSKEQIEGITTLLTEYIGPIAKVLVKTAVSSCTSFARLRQSLAEEVENDSDRDQFLSRVSKFLVQE